MVIPRSKYQAPQCPQVQVIVWPNSLVSSLTSVWRVRQHGRAAQKPHRAREGAAGRQGAKSIAHTELLPQKGRTVEKRRHGTRGGGGEGGGETASVNTQVPEQDQTRQRRIRYKPASKDIK